MVFGSNDRWVSRDSRVDGASPLNHFLQHEKPIFQMGSSFSWWFDDDNLRAKWLEGTRQLLDILQAQERCHFRDLITWDETWVYIDMKPGTVWLRADAEQSVRVKRTIASEKPRRTFFWGIHRIAHYCWLSKGSILDWPFFLWRSA
jgi:hypothetical protein